MNKELTPLDALKKIADCLSKDLVYSQEYLIIETVLKRNIELEHTLKLAEKELEAFWIIKKEISGCLEFHYDEEHNYGGVWCVQGDDEEENSVVIASANSKEEFDLLKEVLK